MAGTKTLGLSVAGFSLALFLAGPVAAQNPPASGPAQTPAPSAPLFNAKASAPDVNGIPVLANMVKTGARLLYMGERSGMDGWLIMKNGQIQMIYVTPDKQTAFIGVMFTAQGEQVTSSQITALSERDKEVAGILSGTAAQQTEVVRAGLAEGGVASVPVPEQKVSSGNDLVNKLPAVPVSPGERLVMDLKASSNVVLGHNEGAELIMVVSPNCSHCKKTWAELRDAVMANKIQVRMVPINRDPEGEEIKVAAQLLRAPDPLGAWDKYVSGDKTALAGEPDEAALKAIAGNRVMTDRWNIVGTPYLVYRGQDNKVKIVQGRPERMAAVLADLTR